MVGIWRNLTGPMLVVVAKWTNGIVCEKEPRWLCADGDG